MGGSVQKIEWQCAFSSSSLQYMHCEGWADVERKRPNRKDRLPRAYFCCRQLAKFRILWGNCLYNALFWPVCCKPAGQCFPDCGVWVSVDFDSKYKILWGETRAHGVPIHERIKKFKTRIYKIIPIFPPPKISDWRKLGWRGRLPLCFLADCSKWYAKMASSRQLLSLIDLSLDIYITFLVSGTPLCSTQVAFMCHLKRKLQKIFKRRIFKFKKLRMAPTPNRPDILEKKHFI